MLFIKKKISRKKLNRFISYLNFLDQKIQRFSQNDQVNNYKKIQFLQKIVEDSVETEEECRLLKISENTSTSNLRYEYDRQYNLMSIRNVRELDQVVPEDFSYNIKISNTTFIECFYKILTQKFNHPLNSREHPLLFRVLTHFKDPITLKSVIDENIQTILMSRNHIFIEQCIPKLQKFKTDVCSVERCLKINEINSETLFDSKQIQQDVINQTIFEINQQLPPLNDNSEYINLILEFLGL